MRHNSKKKQQNCPSCLSLDSQNTKKPSPAAKKLQELISKPNTTISPLWLDKEREVIQCLASIYQNTCAYCEAETLGPEVDHYRPKGSVQEDAKHPGYYWLAYEWTNLLPVCPTCNKKKGTKFPIKSKRIYSPKIDGQKKLDRASLRADSEYLSSEKALLLHPEFDKPEQEFDLDKNGKLIALSQRAHETIECIKLNERDTLCIARKKILDDFAAECKRLLHSLLCELDEEEPLEHIIRVVLNNHIREFVRKAEPGNSFSLVRHKALLHRTELLFPLFVDVDSIGIFQAAIETEAVVYSEKIST